MFRVGVRSSGVRGWNRGCAVRCLVLLAVLTMVPPVQGQIRVMRGGVQRINGRFVPQNNQKQIADAKARELEQALPAGTAPILKPLLRWLFNPGGPMRPPMDDGGVRSGDRDHIDSRAPIDLKAEQMMRAAESAIRRKEWKTAHELLQRLLDLPEDSLHRSKDGNWQSVRRSANQLLESAPPQFQEDYQTQYSGLAQQLLSDARRSGRIADYVSVATRFLHTPAGYEAANYLGSLHLDRGEFGLAAVWFEEISRSSAAIAGDGAWRVKAALAYRQAGNLAASQKLLEGWTESPGNRVIPGLKGAEPEAWIGGTNAMIPTRSLVMDDWKQMYGSISRQGTATGSEPLLSPIWNVPLTSSYPVRRRVDWILQDLNDQDKTPIMAALPLVVNGRALYRDLRGVRAVDIETGKTLWESLEGVSAERILGGLPPQQVESREAWRFRLNQFQNDINEYQGQSVEYHPLASLLFRDGIYGVISSDGRQVFVIEDHGILSRNQPGQNWGWDGSGESQDQYGVTWKTNRLVSYDIQTGRPCWSVGGVESHESFDLPLAGSFFYGTPAIDGDDLLVVAGKGDDLRLWSLDRATGVPRWSQLIAYTDTKIEQDFGRRWFTAQVAAEGGIIVCPTTVGWLVAVDRLRQSVLWAHRYIPPSGSSYERDPNGQYVPQRELSAQWSPSAPIIAGSVVVYTPPEEPIVLALNLLDGRRLWEKPKESWLYLAGVFGDRAVLVGRNEVGAFHASTGKAIWTASLGDARPSGRGQAVDDQYYLPLSNGELRVIDLKTGKKVSRGYVPPAHAPLGNLAMHHGKLVSLSPHGMVGFGQRDAVMAEIQRRKQQDPHDAWALLRDAEIHLLNREHATALPLLKAAVPAGLTADEQARRQTELIECLAAVIRQDPKSHAEDLDELGRLVTSAADKRLHQELSADFLVAQAKFLPAFDVLWALGGQEFSDAGVSRSDDPLIVLSANVWLSSRMLELWTASAGEDRKQVDARVAALVAEAKAGTLAQRQLAVAILGFHPAVIPLQEALIDDLAKASEFGGAQLELLKLAAGTDRAVAARATLRLARLMEEQGLPADANYYYQALETRFGDVAIGQGTAAEFVGQLRAAGKLTSDRRVPMEWDQRPLELVQGHFQYTGPTQEISLRSPLPFYEPLTVVVQQQEQRLAFETVANGQFAWLTPLRSSPRNQGESYAATDFLGHEVVLINRDVLHLVSPVERRVLWTKPLDVTAEGGPFWRHASRPPQYAMTTVSANADQQMTLLQSSSFTGRLAVVQPNYICVYGRRSMTLLDPRTGEWLWRKDGIPQYAQIVGNRDMVCVVPQDRTKSEAYRASDGKLLKIENLGDLLGSALQMRDDSILLQEAGSKTSFLFFNAAKTILRLYQPSSNEDRWKMEFPSGSMVTLLDPDELLVVSPDGKVERIEIASGKRTSLESVPAVDMKGRIESFAIADDDQIYFVCNVRDTGGNHHYGESLPSVRAHGTIHAWKRSDGKLAWRQEVKHQNLVVDRFRAVPILLFVSRSWKQKGNMNYGTLSIQAIHKQTGKVLHDSTTPSNYSNFHSIEINMSEPSIDLKSYNLRMRLIPTNGPVAQVQPAAADEPANKN